MQLIINMNVDNEAFGETEADRDTEVALMLAKVAERIAFGWADDGLHQNILDTNGNMVGTYVFCKSAKIELERAYV
jgi:hypothetical protein